MFSRKLLILYVFLLTVTLLMMGGLFYVRYKMKATRDYREIRAEGILRIVTENNPLGYFASENQIEGFQYELSRAIAQLSGLEVYLYLEMSLENSFKGLQTNQFDIIARNIPTTSELKNDYLFTDPIVLNKQVLVQRKKAYNSDIDPIRNQLHLAHKILYIHESKPVRMRLQHLQHEIGDTIFVIEESSYSSEQLISLVAGGEIDFAVCDYQIALIAQRQHPEIDIQTDISFTQLQSWAIRKTSPVLLDSLNNWLHTIRETGRFDAIYRQYYEQ
jgi:membrane-bound lytic murein transglycosylase MltF